MRIINTCDMHVDLINTNICLIYKKYGLCKCKYVDMVTVNTDENNQYVNMKYVRTKTYSSYTHRLLYSQICHALHLLYIHRFSIFTDLVY